MKIDCWYKIRPFVTGMAYSSVFIFLLTRFMTFKEDWIAIIGLGLCLFVIISIMDFIQVSKAILKVVLIIAELELLMR